MAKRGTRTNHAPTPFRIRVHSDDSPSALPIRRRPGGLQYSEEVVVVPELNPTDESKHSSTRGGSIRGQQLLPQSIVALLDTVVWVGPMESRHREREPRKASA